jgi:hypothetical protein
VGPGLPDRRDGPGATGGPPLRASPLPRQRAGGQWFGRRTNLISDTPTQNRGFVLPFAIDRACVGLRPGRSSAFAPGRGRCGRARPDGPALKPGRMGSYVRRRARAAPSTAACRHGRHAGVGRPARASLSRARLSRSRARSRCPRSRAGRPLRPPSPRRAVGPRSSRPASPAGSWTSWRRSRCVRVRRSSWIAGRSTSRPFRSRRGSESSSSTGVADARCAYGDRRVFRQAPRWRSGVRAPRRDRGQVADSRSGCTSRENARVLAAVEALGRATSPAWGAAHREPRPPRRLQRLHARARHWWRARAGGARGAPHGRRLRGCVVAVCEAAQARRSETAGAHASEPSRADGLPSPPTAPVRSIRQRLTSPASASGARSRTWKKSC